MNQTLKKIKSLVALREVPPPSEGGSINRFKLAPFVSQQEIPNSDIAKRAFMIWQERGHSHGNDFEDWLLARIQLEDELN
jgi:hypothetical protein